MPGNSYDLFPYDSQPFAQTHPERLASIATLLGLEPPRLRGCRVLELGCAAGGNLIPLAEQLPDCELVGLDLSARQIADGRQLCTALDLKHVHLVCGSIAEIDARWGEFDYILCHGVYSWVPPAIQSAILRVCRERLQPQGIAYVSYNTLPGWRMRGAIRDLMRHHALRFDGPHEQVAQARAILDFLVDASTAADPAYGTLLRQEAEILRGAADSYIFHEHLEEVNEPLWFHEFVQRAALHRLKYLAESDFGSMLASGLPPAVAATVHRVAPDVIGQEQLLDFVRNRSFRQTLLVHEERAVTREILLSRLEGLCFAAALEADGTDSFRLPNGTTLTTPAPLTQAALRALGSAWPCALAWPDLLAQATGSAHADAGAIDTLRADLMQCLATQVLQASTSPTACVRDAGHTPHASALARHQAASSARVTTLLHACVDLDETARALLILLDGTRTREGLLAVLRERLPLLDAAGVRNIIDALARAGLLLA